MIQKIIEVLGVTGFSEKTNPLVLIALAYLIFTCIALFSIINIFIYLLSIYLINNNKYLEKITKNYPYVTKIIAYYNNTRQGFILLEVILFLGSMFYMLSISIRIILYSSSM